MSFLSGKLNGSIREFKMTKYFVWEPNMLGPMAVIWHDDQKDGAGKRKPHLKIVELEESDKRTIDQLKEAYPHA